jgi:hypothetical protein
MALQVEDLDNDTKFRKVLSVSYSDLVPFIFEYLLKKSLLIRFFWLVCIITLGLLIKVRFNIAGYYPLSKIFFHSLLGLIVLPLIIIPVHELLHVIPYFFAGARKIRVGMDLKQYLFFVTAHRFVATPIQFKIVALVPFLLLTIGSAVMIFLLPGLWKWSLSLFLFVHTTMCAGDFALLNFYYINRNKTIYSWDDVDKKEAYFYEKI